MSPQDEKMRSDNMKPIQVKAGESAPDVEQLMNKAAEIADRLEKHVEVDNSQLREQPGDTRPAHYWTNQDLPETNVETVSKKTPKPENAPLMDANNLDNGLPSHLNTAGGK